MSELPRKWFSNSRPLPLDTNGKVDFSLEKKLLEKEFQISILCWWKNLWEECSMK